MKKIEIPKLLIEETIDRLRHAIVNGELLLGTRLSEQRLADTLGISRSPVSQALAILATEGLVKIIPKRGSYIFLPDDTDVDELCEYRAILEVAALRMALERQPEALVHVMTHICSAMQSALVASDPGVYAGLDVDFHNAIITNSGNKRLISAYRRTISPILAIRTHVFKIMGSKTDRSLKQHLEILDACNSGDVVLATKLLETHIGHLAKDFSALQNSSDT